MVVVSYPVDPWDPNGWTILPPWRTITLSLDGEVYCIVDEDKYDEIVAEGPWCLYDYGGKQYAKRTRKRGEYGPVAVYMHRWLAQRYLRQPSPRHVIVDHVRSRGLDNRLSRLRWATPSDNRLNVHGRWWQQLDFIRELEELSVSPPNLLDVSLELDRERRSEAPPLPGSGR